MAAQNKSELRVIFLTVFLYLVGFGVIIPLLPILSRDLGATSFQLGLLMAVYSLNQFLFSPFWGAISDRVGRRPVLLSCLGLEILCYIVFAFARSVEMLIVARALAGFFGASLSTASAAVSDVTGESERSKGMALIGAAFGLGFIFGPALGGGLALWGGRISDAPFFATTFTLLGVAVLCLVNFLVALRYLKETKVFSVEEGFASAGIDSLAVQGLNAGGVLDPRISENSTRNKLNGKSWRLRSEWKRGLLSLLDKVSAMRSILGKPVIGTLVLAFALASIAMSTMESTLALFVADHFGWGLFEISLGFVYIGVLATIMQGYLVRKLLPRFGEKVLLRVGLLMLALSLGMIGFADQIWILGVAMTILPFGQGLVNPAVLGSVSLLSDSSEQGRMLGTAQGFSALGRIIGPLLGGWAYTAVSNSSPYYLSGAIALVAAILIWRMGDKIPSTALRKAT